MTQPDGPKDAAIRFGQPSADRTGPRPFGRLGAVTGVLAVLLVAGGLVWSAASGRPVAAQRPAFFGGSLVLEDTRPLTVIDVATAQITVRLQGVDAQVGSSNYGDVQAVAVSGGTLLVNRVTGSFNYLEADDYVTDPNGPGVGLGSLPGSTGALGLAAGPDAYVLRGAARGTVSLVGQSTVAAAARAEAGLSRPAVQAVPAAAVAPIGFAALPGSLSAQAGMATVSGRDLWVLAGEGFGCQVLELQPAPTSRQGLVSSRRAGFGRPCAVGAAEAGSAAVGVASPGQLLQFPSGSPAAAAPTRVAVPFTSAATRILPVTGAGRDLWFVARVPSGWLVFGADPEGRILGPYPLAGLGLSADPVPPVLSAGFLYTLDQAASGQPTLWTIATANGHMAPLRGVPAYPVLSKAEKASFTGAQVLLDGPRVVFNNPQSLEAVVVFTDGSRPPAVVDKSRAVSISPTGPADLNVRTPTSRPGGPGKANAGGPARTPVPAVQPVSQQITCANTTQKPYAPQITDIVPSSGGAVIQWSYQLLDQTDCEPDSWSVAVTAVGGGHQPAHPLQVVYGQSQYQFEGLRPATTYQVVVTAYINRQSTPSAPVAFTTTARGPDAPLSVRTVADGHGDWVVSWTPCTETVKASCVVPAAQWSIVGAACGGSFVGTPPTVQVPGAQDSVTISAANLKMLGDSLSFTVQGSLASGLQGDPTGDRSCTEAWAAPQASAIGLQGSGAPAADGSVTATLVVTASGDPTAAFGVPPADSEFVYSIGGRTVGPTSQTRVSVAGLPAGESFTPTVTVYPAGHQSAAVTVTGNSFSRTLPWPADITAATATGGPDPSNPNQGSFTVNFPPDLPGGPLTAGGPDPASNSGPVLQCGGSGGAPLQYPAQPVQAGKLSFSVADLVHTGGTCNISFTLNDTANPDPYGGPSPVVQVPIQLGQYPSYQFTLALSSQCQTYGACGGITQPWELVISADSPKMAAGGDWAVDSKSGNPVIDTACGAHYPLSGPSDFPYTFDLPKTCLGSMAAQVHIYVSYTYVGTTQPVDLGAPPMPSPPATTTTTTVAPTTTTTTTTTTGSPGTTAKAAARPIATVLAAARPGRGPGAAARDAVGWLFTGLAAVGLGAGHRRRNRQRNHEEKGTP